MITDPYKVLGLEPGATDEQVKSAYKELVKKYHLETAELAAGCFSAARLDSPVVAGLDYASDVRD